MYVGISQNPEQRWKRHRSDAKNPKKIKFAIQLALNKYGEENFIFKKIEEYDTWEEACQGEIKWIKELKILGHQLYNETGGGEGAYGFIWTDEQKKRASERMTGEGNHMFGVQLFGEANGNYGKEMKPHVKNELLKHRRKLTDEQIINIRNLYASGNYTQTKLAQEFNISLTQIFRIVSNQSWTDNPNRNVKIKPNITEKEVLEIRKLYDSQNFSQAELGKKYNISSSQVGRIIRRERWKDI